MNKDYRIYLIHEGRDQWAFALMNAISTDLCNHNIEVNVEFPTKLNDVIKVSCPSVAVYLGSSQSLQSETCKNSIDKALNLGILIIPVVEDEKLFKKYVPHKLHAINAFIWREVSASETLARHILRELGLTEVDRRVFICHRRTDGLGMADQLFDNLSHKRFTVFLDRFNVEVGRDFQQAIKESLEEISFLLVIESPEAYKSIWIPEEVNYALRHHMALLILSWPSTQIPIPNTEGLPGIRLNEADLTILGNYQKLTDHALNRIISEIEYRHADGLLRRRRYLLESVKKEALKYYRTCLNIGNWTLLLKNGLNQRQNAIIVIIPRLPNAFDLYRLESPHLRLNNVSLSRKFLVHLTESVPKEKSYFLEWVINNRPLQMIILEKFIGGSVL